MEIAADKDLSNNFKSVMMILCFILEEMKKKSPGGIIEKYWKNLQK